MESVAERSIAVEILPGCTLCGLCEAIAPEVFRVTDRRCTLRPEARWGEFVEAILEAEKACPSGAIRCARV